MSPSRNNAAMSAPLDPHRYIEARLRLAPVPSLPAIRLYTAHSGSGLGRLGGDTRAAPYWAYPWAGGLALAHHVLAHPETVAGRRLLDLGAGSGLVGIAAARAGAREVWAAEIDPFGRAAIALNAAANAVEVRVPDGDPTRAPPPPVDLVLAGDVFYDPAVARRMIPFLDACLAARLEVLVGDPGRPALPRARLRAIADYAVPDVGDAASAAGKPGTVYAFTAAP